MIKTSIYEKQNIDSIKYTLYTIGLGTLKLFAVFLPHITEEIYHDFYKQFEKTKSIQVSDWPEPILVDNEMETAGEHVKNYISQVRSWKSDQGIALNAPMNTTATYASKDLISKFQQSGSIIKSTLKFPDSHKFIPGKPDVEEKITKVTPVYAKIGPTFKKDGKKLADWINKNQQDIAGKIEKHGDIKISEIPVLKSDKKEGMMEEGFIKIEKEAKVKGKKDSTILSFDKFYLELKA
jgi:valyl-tRNA synthetase